MRATNYVLAEASISIFLHNWHKSINLSAEIAFRKGSLGRSTQRHVAFSASAELVEMISSLSTICGRSNSSQQRRAEEGRVLTSVDLLHRLPAGLRSTVTPAGQNTTVINQSDQQRPSEPGLHTSTAPAEKPGQIPSAVSARSRAQRRLQDARLCDPDVSAGSLTSHLPAV